MFGRKKKTTAARDSVIIVEDRAADVERIIVLYRDAEPRPNELLQLVEAVLGPGFSTVQLTARQVPEPTEDLAYAVVASFQSDGRVSAEALARTSTRSFQTVKGPVVVAVVWRTAPRGPFQRPSGSFSATQPSASIPHEQRTCPLCGSSRLLTEQRAARAQVWRDKERGIALDFTVTQINCAACGALVDDDVNGDTVAAYRRLTTRAGTPPPQISAMVHDAMQHAEMLPALSEPERQRDYDQARQRWDCLGMRYVPAEEFQDALTRIFRGYFAEGATEVQIKTLEQHVVQLSFITSWGFCPVRFSRAAEGGFSVYGQVPVYRFLGDGKPTPGTRQATAAESTSREDVLEAATASTELADAEVAWRTAAEAGDPRAMNNLAVVLSERGELAEAESWYRKAADGGNTDAMYNLGVTLAERGEFAETESWYRKAANGGNTDAMYNLGVALTERGEPAEGATWYRKAADAGHTTAMYNLGVTFAERGEFAEATSWYRRGADGGNTDAMYNLGVVLVERGELHEAETWYRKAADAGDTGAMYNLGALFQGRGEFAEAESWWRKAADAGKVTAMYNLGVALAGRGQFAEAQSWWRKAADAGNTDAMAALAASMYQRPT